MILELFKILLDKKKIKIGFAFQGDFNLFKKFVLSAKFNDWNDLLKFHGIQ